jgi:hypothetical protein
MLEEIKKAILEVQQPRSRFQIEKFVLGQHSTVEMQYYQVCLELQDLIHKYEFTKIAKKKNEVKIARLRATGDELDELEAQEIELGQAQTLLAVLGAERELAHLVDIWSGFQTKFSREQIELAQPDYWKKRLVTNARAMISGGAGINPAHIEAMEQAGVLQDFVAEIEIEKKELGL